MTAPLLTIQRVRMRVTGVVQGVGFRPFVYRLAHALHLAGFVGNDSEGVFIEVEGTPDVIHKFRQRLVDEQPPLAHIESVQVQNMPPRDAVGFEIVHSETHDAAHTLISPDLCICDDCLRELNDPNNRRYRYPFINCTNCGPRFTITKAVPYDRPLTTMADFAMCPACQAEYDDPLNRRFHAQPNACPDCGPQVSLVQGEQTALSGDAAVHQTVEALANGQIVAVKGIGGFHLACDATNTEAVLRLRERKQRPGKPFALMARDLVSVQQFAHVSVEEAKLLTSRERPVVLLRKRSALFDAIAPGNGYVGVMLPYTPLHYLLVGDNPLVMTSANISGEPIIKDNDEALAKLRGIADAFLMHNRDIHVHCDDSVVRTQYPIRRSRGYAPFPVKLPFAVRPSLAVGGELKSTFCLTSDNHAFMSQHIGDMENLETLHAFESAAAHMQSIFRIQPEYVVCDLHPRYLSSQWAERHAAERDLPLFRVQHHHAHIAAVMAENGVAADESVIGFSFDGTGYGTDGTVWGGEVFVAGYREFRQVAHLAHMPLPGGDTAVKRPYRLALAYLWMCGLDISPELAPVKHSGEQERRILYQQLQKNLNVVQTSSMGRLFDVVASLLGICHEVTYEGQAAIELEAAAEDGMTGHYPFVYSRTILVKPLLQAIITDLADGVPASMIAAKFHHTIAVLIVWVSLSQRDATGLNTVALSGGVFQNIRLLQAAIQQLEHNNFRVLTHKLVPPNDGGLALGQAVIAHFLNQEK